MGQTGLSTQCRPRSDAAECSIWSGSTQFATNKAVFWTHQQTVKWSYSSFRLSTVRRLGVPILKVTTVECCGAVVKSRTRDREVPGLIPTNSKCCFLEQETLSTSLSTGFYPGKKRATWKISTRILNVLPSINKVDYYYYYYYL